MRPLQLKYMSHILVLRMAPLLFLSRIHYVWMTSHLFRTFLDHVCMPVLHQFVRPLRSFHMSTLSPWSSHTYLTQAPSLHLVPLPTPTSPSPLVRLFFPFRPPPSFLPFPRVSPSSPPIRRSRSSPHSPSPPSPSPPPSTSQSLASCPPHPLLPPTFASPESVVAVVAAVAVCSFFVFPEFLPPPRPSHCSCAS